MANIMKISVKLENSKATLHVLYPDMNIDRTETIDDVCKAEEVTVTKKQPITGLGHGRYFFLQFFNQLDDEGGLVRALNRLLMGTQRSRYLPQEYLEENMYRYYIRLYKEDEVVIQ